MATPVWPILLAQEPDPGPWSWAPQNNKVSFKPAVGPSIERRRGTAVVHNYNATFSYLTTAEVSVFEDFYQDDLSSGVLHYLWNDPVSGVSHKWKIESYTLTSVGAALHRLTMSLKRLPGAAV